MGKSLSSQAVTVLGSMEVEGHLARITAGQLDRKLYLEVNKALEAIGGKWSQKLGGHVFTEDPRDALDQVVLTGRFTDRKQEFGFFETPPALAARVVEMAKIRPGMKVLEPSCGRGALLREVLAQQPAARIYGVEILPENVRASRALGVEVDQADFMSVEAPCERVVMNPPFSRQQDVDHVTRAFRQLRPGGRLVSIMAAGVKFRQNRKAREFQALLYEVDGDVIDLPPGSFRESGTEVETVIVTLDKAA